MAQQSVKETLEQITESILNIKDTLNSLGMNGNDSISTYGNQINNWGVEKVTELNNTRSELDNLQTAYDGQQSIIDNLNTQIIEKDTAISTKDGVIADLNIQINNLNDSINNLNNQIVEKDASISNLNTQIESLNEQIKELNEELENLSGGDERIAELIEQISLLEAEIVVLTQSNSSLTTENNDLKQSNAELQTNVEALSASVGEKEATIQEYEENFDDIYDAIVSKGSTASEGQYETYAAGILAIEGSGGGSGGGTTEDFEINNCYQLFGMGNNGSRGNAIKALLPHCKNVTNWNNAFDCALIPNGEIVDIDATAITNDNNTYFFYKAMPENNNAEITLKARTNGRFRYAFTDCNSSNTRGLVNAAIKDVGSGDFDNLSQMFAGAKNIKSISVDANCSNVKYLNNTFKYFNDGYRDGILTDLDMSTWGIDWSKVREMQAIFYGAKNLKTIKLGEPCVVINNVYFNDAVHSCENLTQIEICLQDTESIGNDWYKAGAFYDCKNLESVISEQPWYLRCNIADMFKGCSKLVNLPVIHLEKTAANTKDKDTGGVFEGCTSLEEVEIYIDLDNTKGSTSGKDMQRFFYNCSKLRKVKGNFDLSYLYKIDNAFYNCIALEEIEATGQIGIDKKTNDFTLDLSASAVFNIGKYLQGLDTNTTGGTRTIKLHSTVFNGLNDDIKALATSKNYILSS